MIQSWPKLFTDHRTYLVAIFWASTCSRSSDYSWKNEAEDSLFNQLDNSDLEELTTYSKSIGADNEFIT
ncbi:FAD linked oxidase N-terminal [Penicillium hordei]|uniref:FAD linked oxidase N-terminal n=1 Tax=Penicillium hordei TaxID=40994 RepID=A0AAD6EAR8_9EURO|nr:FAD linked oxidase N-terminal [Penicillium hordei]KAJ5607533.1 FAD linked oxidase N-terminal [Penicillium hordei]